MSSDQNEILHGGWSSGGSSAKFKFHQNRLSAFGAVGVKICCLPMTWPNQWENGQINGKEQISTPHNSKTAYHFDKI